MIEIEKDFEKGSGNVYADLESPEPEMMKRKADLVREISELIEKKGLTRQSAAEITSIPAAELSKLLQGQFRMIDESSLLEFINKLQTPLR